MASMYETGSLPTAPDPDDREACARILRRAGFRVGVEAGQGDDRPAPDLSPTWRCRRCGTERHFAEPVPAAASSPCAGCGEDTVHTSAEG